MSAARCSDCERNVSLEIGDTEVNETNFDDSNYSVEVEFNMPFNCAECETNLGEYTGTSDQVVPKLEDYLESHENVDVGDAVCDEAEIIETEIIKKAGRKIYLAKWATQVRLNNEVFNVAGEMAVTQDQIELS